MPSFPPPGAYSRSRGTKPDGSRRPPLAPARETLPRVLPARRSLLPDRWDGLGRPAPPRPTPHAARLLPAASADNYRRALSKQPRARALPAISARLPPPLPPPAPHAVTHAAWDGGEPLRPQSLLSPPRQLRGAAVPA